MNLGLLSFLAKGVACTLLYNYSQRQNYQSMYTKVAGMNSCPQQNEQSEAEKAFKRYVQSLYGKEYLPGKIQLREREIAYQMSEAITLSYDYNNHYLLIKSYLETKNLPKETMRSRILGDYASFEQVFLSMPYDAICIAMPPSCLNNNQNVTGIINRMESVWAEYATAHIEQ